jgi:uncharacterized membrane-anchored protein YitT (DUF2179 family)
MSVNKLAVAKAAGATLGCVGGVALIVLGSIFFPKVLWGMMLMLFFVFVAGIVLWMIFKGFYDAFSGKRAEEKAKEKEEMNRYMRNMPVTKTHRY